MTKVSKKKEHMKRKSESASKKQMATQLKENECVIHILLINSTEGAYVGSREIFSFSLLCYHS